MFAPLKWNQNSKSLTLNSLIDPLENVKLGSNSETRKIRQRSRSELPVTTISNTALNIDNVDLADENKISKSLDQFDSGILSYETQILKALPSEMLKAFKTTANVFLPNYAMMTVLIYGIILIPVLFVVEKTIPGADLMSFLNIWPFLFAFPFACFWLWEDDLVKIPYLDNYLRSFISNRIKQAMTILARDEDELIESILTEKDKNVILEYALLKLLVKLDPHALTQQVLELQRQLKKDPVLRKSLIEQSELSLTDLNKYGILNFNYLLWKTDDQMAYGVAAGRILKQLENDGYNDEEALNLLKDFRGDLDKEFAKDSPDKRVRDASFTDKSLMFLNDKIEKIDSFLRKRFSSSM
jgi:hypothetical protein